MVVASASVKTPQLRFFEMNPSSERFSSSWSIMLFTMKMNFSSKLMLPSCASRSCTAFISTCSLFLAISLLRISYLSLKYK